jgi:hypothetical protein
MKPTFILILAGLILLLLGMRQMKSGDAYVAHAVKAQGEVVALAEKRYIVTKGKAHKAFYPVVRFTADGREMRFTSDMAGSQPEYKVGDKVEVVYDPADPSKAKINHPASTHAAGYALCAAGVALIVAGVVLR